MKYLFDVGAHWGQDSLDRVRNEKDLICFAFEPTPELAENLRKEAESRGIKDRYRVFETAISDFDGEADFHMVANDTGSASLNEFSNNLDKTWPGRTDFVVRASKKVNVYRLDTWLPIYAPEITEIEHLHIDAQGSDLAVLRGLGEKLKMVKSGVVEVPQSEEVRLYKGQHTKEEAIQFLVRNGFKISSVVSQVNEDNLFFEREE
jgi:FkbM family methyltransferase